MLAVEASAGMKTSGTLTPRGRGPPAGVKADNCPKTVAAVGMVKLTLGPPLGLFCYCHLCVRRPAEWDPAVEPAGERSPAMMANSGLAVRALPRHSSFSSILHLIHLLFCLAPAQLLPIWKNVDPSEIPPPDQPSLAESPSGQNWSGPSDQRSERTYSDHTVLFLFLRVLGSVSMRTIE